MVVCKILKEVVFDGIAIFLPLGLDRYKSRSREIRKVCNSLRCGVSKVRA